MPTEKEIAIAACGAFAGLAVGLLLITPILFAFDQPGTALSTLCFSATFLLVAFSWFQDWRKL